MIPNPPLALAIALGSALVASIAVFVYTDRRARRRIALLCRQRPPCVTQPQRTEAPRHSPPRRGPGKRELFGHVLSSIRAESAPPRGRTTHQSARRSRQPDLWPGLSTLIRSSLMHHHWNL